MVRPLPAALLLLAGCAVQTGDFPSLAPRAIEKLDTAEPTPPPAAAVPADPALAARVAALLGDAEAGDREFAAVRSAVAPRLRTAANAAVGSEGWIAAEAALSRLAVARDRTAAALQALDALAIEHDDDPAVASARDRAAALDSAQAAILSALSRDPPPGRDVRQEDDPTRR